MKIDTLHRWDVTPAEARALQTELAGRIDTTRRLGTWETIAAADVSYNKFSEWLHAAVVVVRAGTFELVEWVGVKGKAGFPYVPGLLSFREAPAVLDAFRALKVRPDVVLCDGQGTAHPRRMGLACHLGLWLNVPTIGCAKSVLCGTFAEPGPERGACAPLIDQDEVVGTAVRTRARVKPVYVSPGHLCDRESAVRVVLAATSKYRLPDAARQAHHHVNELRRAAGESPAPAR